MPISYTIDFKICTLRSLFLRGLQRAKIKKPREGQIAFIAITRQDCRPTVGI